MLIRSDVLLGDEFTRPVACEREFQNRETWDSCACGKPENQTLGNCGCVRPEREGNPWEILGNLGTQWVEFSYTQTLFSLAFVPSTNPACIILM
jgi:hypothetical protein